MLRKKSLHLLISLFLLIALAAVAVPGFAQSESVEATVSPDLLNVRQTPSTGAAIVNQLPLGTVVTVSGREDLPNNGGSWVYITPNDGGAGGWVLARYLLFPGAYNIGVLPVVSTTGGGSTTAAGSSAASSGGVTGANIQGTTNDFANFRSGPELTFGIIRTLQPNTPIILLGRNATNVWINVAVGNQTGWIFHSLVKSPVALNTLPVVGAEGAALPASAAVQLATTSGEDTDSASTTTTSGASVSAATAEDIAFGVKPGTEGGWDGRLNQYDDLGYALVYCVDSHGYSNVSNYSGGGILVYRTDASKTVLFASEAQIAAAGSNPPGGRLITQQGGYALYRLEEGLFLLTGQDFRGESFSFRWNGCQVGQKVG